MPVVASNGMGGIRRSTCRPRSSLTSLRQDGSSIRAISGTSHGQCDALSVGGQNIQQFQRRGRRARFAISANVVGDDAVEDTDSSRRAVSAPSQHSATPVLNQSGVASTSPTGSALSAVRGLAPSRDDFESLTVLPAQSPGASLELSGFLSGDEAESAEAPGVNSGIPLQQGELLPEADDQVAEALPVRDIVPHIEVKHRRNCSSDDVLHRYGYARVKKLGEGSFGTAVLVRGARGLCVCKIVDLRGASARDQRDALQEGNVLAKLKHPYVVRYQESFVENGWMCIVMRYCSGGSLAGQISQAWRRSKPFTEEQVLTWFTQTLLALKYIHEKHLLHRDLKPDNLFLKRDGTLQMGDFGTCRVLEHTAACAKTQVGTPYYLSPEVCQAKPYSWQADMWSTGCILFELCSFKVPFDAPSISCLVKKICRDPAPQLQPHQWATEVQELVGELLTKDPTIRPSAADMLTRPKIQSSIERLVVAVQVAHDDNGSVSDVTTKRRQRATLPALARPCFHPSLIGAAATEPIRRLCHQAAKSISRTMTESNIPGGVCSRDTMRADEEGSMRQLYLQCIESNPDVILSEIALPLKEELMQTDMGQQLLQGTSKTVTVAAGGVAVDIDKEAFSIGRYAICDVSLPGCLDISRMQLWVFNLPGGIVVVDGWSLAGSAVLAREQAVEELASSEPGARRALVVPHDEAVILRLGGQAVSLNPKPCVVCLDRPRAVQLGCGHRALCGRCAAVARECPLCKQNVDPSAVQNSFRACVGATFAGAPGGAQPTHAVPSAA